MSESGANCIVINDPVTFPPEKVRGIMTTGLMTPPGSTNWIYPKELRSELDAAAGGYEPDIPANFKSLFIEDKRKSLGILEELTAKIFRLSTYAIENYDWDVFAVIFTSTDRLQHYWWDDPTVLSQHYRAIDAIVGEYIKYAEQTMADLIVVSDHGFGPVNKVFCVNEWLKRSGLAVAKESTFARFLAKSGLTRQRMRNVWGEWPTAFRVLPAVLQDLVRAYIPDAAESNNELDIGDSAVYAKSSAGVFVRDKHRLEFVAQKLRKAIDESTGQSIFENVLKRDEVLRGPYCYRAPDLFFKPVIGYDPCPNDNDRIGRTGTHRPEGIFLHYRSGSSLEQHSDKEIRPWDVAALVLDVLGLPIPEYFDGKARL
jgi:predicted AlkP superfamily phosphohydrolase/phosphomutase